MPLDDPLLSLACNGLAYVAAHIWLWHPAIQDVDALFLATVDDGPNFLRVVALKPFASKADFADHEACLAQSSVSHALSSL